ncbi:MAG: hypothetical protein QM817_34895 [Archangium sp.]
MTKTKTEALRDRYFELLTSKSVAERQAFRDEVNALDVEACTRVSGLRVHWHPTARFKQLRFFEAERLDADVRAQFAHPAPALPHLAAGFVDPQELSFRTFENIVSLDALFSSPASLKLEDRVRFGKKQVYAFKLGADDVTRAKLLQLDSLGLYAPPLNQGSRGGERFIFHSTALADGLTAAVKEGLGASLLNGFAHVNPIFRCNRFEPGDEKFHEHFDTPYFDANRRHISKWTLLLYLTSGKGTPALSVEGEGVLTDVPEFTCVVLDQALAHEGRAFDAGRKVFLRTELIFEEPKLEHDPKLAETFGRAVYLTGESVFRPELEKHAEAAYNLAAAGHWRGLAKVDTAPLVQKKFGAHAFVTNGFDFWFPREQSLTDAAALALLDFFNAEVDGKAFRKTCKTKVVDELPKSLDVASALTVLDKEALFPPSEESNGACCPFHRGLSFDPVRHDEIIDLYESAQRFAKKHVGPAPVLLMGDEVFIDPSRFVVDGDKVHVLSEQALTPVNFAACWNFGGSPDNYVGVDSMVTALQPLVPPLSFGVEGAYWHLRLDFFRNSWLVKERRLEVPIPLIRNIDPGQAEDEGETPWLDAVGDELVDDTAPKAKSTVWWGNDSPLLRELTANGLKRFH